MTLSPSRRPDRFLAAILALISLFALAVLPAAAQSPAPGTPEVPPTVIFATQTPGPTANRAGLVIAFSPTDVRTYCVKFSEPEIGGDELLLRSGVGAIIGSEASVCAIGAVGCPVDDCFCRCPFPECLYWGYYQLWNGEWVYSQLGAPFTVVQNGDVDGWSWGQGDFQSGVKPPVFTFAQICPDATPTPAPPWPMSSRTPSPTPTATPTPTPQPPPEIPEPSSLLLAATGLAALVGAARRLARR